MYDKEKKTDGGNENKDHASYIGNELFLRYKFTLFLNFPMSGVIGNTDEEVNSAFLTFW